MKKYLKILPVVLIVLFVLSLQTSCSDSDIDSPDIYLGSDDVFKNSLGVMSSSGVFKRLDRIDLNLLIKSDLNFDFKSKNVEFHDYKIIEKFDEDNNAEYYLTSKSTSNSASISIKLNRDNSGNLLVTADGCKCESTDCLNGCNASGAGSTCKCSQCFQTCKKTSTSGGDKGDPSPIN